MPPAGGACRRVAAQRVMRCHARYFAAYASLPPSFAAAFITASPQPD